MTRTIRRVLLAFLSALLATGGLLAATTPPASAVPVNNIVVTSSDSLAVSGQGVELTITMSGPSGPPTGSVAVLDGVIAICPSAPLVTIGDVSVAICSTSTLSVGAHAITADYAGDGTYDPVVSSPAFEQEVAKASTTTTVESDSPTSTFGDAVTLTATVAPVEPGAGNPTGTVEFLVAGEPITGCTTQLVDAGEATCTTSALPGGDSQVGADYSGDGSFTGSSATTIVQTQNAAPTTTALTTNVNPSAFNSAITLTATATSTAGTPAGAVAFRAGGTDIAGCGFKVTGGGIATCVTSTLSVGEHELTAVYGAGGEYAGSTSNIITQVVTVATTTNLTSSFNPSRFGQAVQLDATVTSTAGVPTGSVDFYIVHRDSTREIIATEPLIDGTATTTRRELSVRTDTPIVAEYTGEGNYDASTDTLLQTVSRSLSRTLMRSSANPSRFGRLITLTVTVNAMGDGEGTPRGKVAFYRVTDGVRKWIGTAVLVDGIAKLRTSKTPVGVSSMIARYNGNGEFRRSSRTGVQRVHAI